MSTKPKHALLDQVEILDGDGKKVSVTLDEVSCGDGRDQPCYWAKDAKGTVYQFDESEILSK